MIVRRALDVESPSAGSTFLFHTTPGLIVSG
jgi:hypothetical protein